MSDNKEKQLAPSVLDLSKIFYPHMSDLDAATQLVSVLIASGDEHMAELEHVTRGVIKILDMIKEQMREREEK